MPYSLSIHVDRDPSQQMQPCAMVEEALVCLAMVAMEMVENVERGDDGEERVREVWSQLANKLVFFYFLQLINITSVINLLRQKVSGCVWIVSPATFHTTAAVFQPLSQGPQLANVVSSSFCH